MSEYNILGALLMSVVALVSIKSEPAVSLSHDIGKGGYSDRLLPSPSVAASIERAAQRREGFK